MDQPGQAHSKWFLPTILTESTAKDVISSGKKRIKTLIEIITGHCSLNKHMNRLDVRDSNICRCCLNEEETLLHLICECEAIVSQRIQYFREKKLRLTDVHQIPGTKLLGFFEETELL